MRTRLIGAISVLGLLAACGTGPAVATTEFQGESRTQTAISTTAAAATTTTTSSSTTIALPTTTPTTAIPPTTATSVTRADQPTLVLRHDGLGAASFGEPVDSVMEVLAELFGPPDWDEIQISADIDYSVKWDDPYDLYLQFTYWDYFAAAPDPLVPMPEGPVFHYYLAKSSMFATEAGITVGSSVGELEAAYPDVRLDALCDDPWSFEVDPPGSWLQLPFFGLLDGDPSEAATRILYIGAGWDRTPC